MESLHLDPFFTNNDPNYKDKNIGDFTYGKPNLLWWTKDCRIGKFCSIAGGVTIMGGGEHRPDWVTTFPFSALPKIFTFAKDFKGHPHSKGPTIIGNDVWIGSEAFILSGVTVGDGACIGARALIAKDVPPYSIVGGNPGKVIKYRFNSEQIRDLLNIRWWDWDLATIEKSIHLLLSNNIEKFITFGKLYNKLNQEMNELLKRSNQI